LPELENISKEELYVENIGLKETNKGLKEKVVGLQFQIDQFNRLVFGQTRERFVPAQSPQQATLFAPVANPSTAPESNDMDALLRENQENDTANPRPELPKKKGQKAGKANPNHHGRNAFPAHLPRVEEILTPEIVQAHPTDFTKIGQEVTETLDYIPAKLFVRRRVREKYVAKNPKSPKSPKNTQNPNPNSSTNTQNTEGPPAYPAYPAYQEGVLIAPLPDRALPKSLAEAGFLAQIAVDKYVDHLPIDRQTKRWDRECGVKLKGSTLVGLCASLCGLLLPLHDKLVELVFDCAYLQADESTIQSLEDAPKGKSHRSYQWVYRNVAKGLIVFDYQRGRSGECLHPSVKTHTGYLQTDGYDVYDALGGLPNLILMNCMAHARRKFFEAKQNDPQRAEKALDFIQQLYKIEENSRKEGLSAEDIKKQRQEKSVPILAEFKTWLETEHLQTLPQSPIGKAFGYTLKRWAKLTVYVTDGQLEIDTNRIENAIRPLALGRKNYLFVGSDEGGKRTAMMYSFFATCKVHNVNPLEWLTDVLNRIPNHPINKIHELLPHLWHK
jgi:transposase